MMVYNTQNHWGSELCIKPVDDSEEGEHLLAASPTTKAVYRSKKNHYEVMKKQNLYLYRRIIVKYVGISTCNTV
jgi:hypothetical protein